VTVTRLRFDAGEDFSQPDRSEFFWARIRNIVPAAVANAAQFNIGKGPTNPETNLRYESFSLYQEVATARASFFIETPYTAEDPTNNAHSSGFGDINLGTKALLFDFLQLSMQVRTYIPTGKFLGGLGTGHVSLEPSILMTVKLLPETYFQGQVSEWIPIGGDQAYEGSVLHYHMAINHVLWRCMPDVPLIGSLEFNGYSFQDGLFTDPVLGPVPSSNGCWLLAGPSLRLSVCNRLDFGVSAQFGLENGPPQQLYRGEMRLRF
jgi:hypothetical protein